MRSSWQKNEVKKTMGGATVAYNRFTPKYKTCFVIAAYQRLDDEMIQKISSAADKLSELSTKQLKDEYGI